MRTASFTATIAKIFAILVTSSSLVLAASVVHAQPLPKTATPNEGIINKMSRNFAECPIIAGSRATVEVKMALAGNRINSEEWLVAKMRTGIIAEACRSEAHIRFDLAPRPVTGGGAKPEMTMPVIERVPAEKLKFIS